MEGDNVKYIIRVHTTLSRVKIYEAINYYTTGNELIIIGTNVKSQLSGEFHYPLYNIEHYNVMDNGIYKLKDLSGTDNDQFNK